MSAIRNSTFNLSFPRQSSILPLLTRVDTHLVGIIHAITQRSHYACLIHSNMRATRHREETRSQSHTNPFLHQRHGRTSMWTKFEERLRFANST